MQDLSAGCGLARLWTLMNISLRRKTRTVKRGPDTEQRRADLVKSCQGTPWDRLARRPAGRPRKTAHQAPPVATPPAATASEQPSDDADERRSAKAQDPKPPAVPHVPPVPRAEEKENEPSTASVDPAATIFRRSGRRSRLQAVRMHAKPAV